MTDENAANRAPSGEPVAADQRGRVLADGLGFPEGPVFEVDGSILVSEMAEGRVSRITGDRARETVADVGGGPNGLARLAGGQLVVAQSGGSSWGIGPWPRPGPGSVDIFRPVGAPDQPLTPQVQVVGDDGRCSTLATTFRSLSGDVLPLSRPSDVTADAEGGFYLTDFGAVRGRSRDVTGVLHGTPDGELAEVVFPLEMPNGVALSPDGTTLYVTETRTRRVWAFDVVRPGHLGAARSLQTLPAGGPLAFGGADGLCIDPEGRIVAATLGIGGATVLDPGGAILGLVPLPDPLTTNGVGSPDGRTLIATLGSTGRVVAVDDWYDRLVPVGSAPFDRLVATGTPVDIDGWRAVLAAP